MEQFQQTHPHLLHLFVTRLRRGFQIRFLFFADAGLANSQIDPINQLTIGYDCSHDCLKPLHPSCGDVPDMEAAVHKLLIL